MKDAQYYREQWAQEMTRAEALEGDLRVAQSSVKFWQDSSADWQHIAENAFKECNKARLEIAKLEARLEWEGK